jgi:hypothetical protein
VGEQILAPTATGMQLRGTPATTSQSVTSALEHFGLQRLRNEEFYAIASHGGVIPNVNIHRFDTKTRIV